MNNIEIIKNIEDPDELKKTLVFLLAKIDSLENKLSELTEKKDAPKIILKQKNKLEEIRHGLSELNERMQKPYLVSAELEAVKEVLDILSEARECNSIILEGEPGTGKTQWAYSEVGQELKEGKDVSLIHIRVKDTMRAQDLLYTIDDVRRLSDAQTQAQMPEEIKKEAQMWKEKIIHDDLDLDEDRNYKKFKAKMDALIDLGETAKNLDYLNYVDLGPLGEAIYQSGKGKKVYLVIDEIEKGREELMTGILDEIENLTFTISETGSLIKGDKKNLRIIITTNTEDSDKIPPSFRRRSLYYYMDYPNPEDMKKIVELNFPDIQKELLNYAISVFYEYHENDEIEKKPSTPELLAWIRVLNKEFNGFIPDDIPHKEILLKYRDDQELEIGQINIKNIEDVENREVKIPNFVFKALQGERVFRLDSAINEYHYRDKFIDFYTRLQNAGINFVTPKFAEREVEDDYGNRGIIQENIAQFQLIMPGVENLGNSYYIIPRDKMKLLESVIKYQVEVLKSGQEFSKVFEKTKNFTVGGIEIDGNFCPAYMTEDNQIVIVKPFKH